MRRFIISIWASLSALVVLGFIAGFASAGDVPDCDRQSSDVVDQAITNNLNHIMAQAQAARDLPPGYTSPSPRPTDPFPSLTQTACDALPIPFRANASYCNEAEVQVGSFGGKNWGVVYGLGVNTNLNGSLFGMPQQVYDNWIADPSVYVRIKYQW